ncbi:MAG: hypothetical protein LBB79_08425 [Prevotellaceae bacterium]|nr:hypothetical protein [Prevotellaceae bacterium]
MKDASDLQHLAPRPHPRPLSKGEGRGEQGHDARRKPPLSFGEGPGVRSPKASSPAGLARRKYNSY